MEKETKHTLSQEDKDAIDKWVHTHFWKDHYNAAKESAEFGVLHERERLQTELSEMKKEREELIQKLKDLEHAFWVSNSKYTDWIPTGELNDTFSNVRELISRIQNEL